VLNFTAADGGVCVSEQASTTHCGIDLIQAHAGCRLLGPAEVCLNHDVPRTSEGGQIATTTAATTTTTTPDIETTPTGKPTAVTLDHSNDDTIIQHQLVQNHDKIQRTVENKFTDDCVASRTSVGRRHGRFLA